MKNILKIFTVMFLALNIMPVLATDDTSNTEQSKANRLLTSASIAATGIGAMELMQGLSEQKADKAADADMSAYISTMRCSYGNGKSVKAGADEIELPGGNDANLMKYRSEYTALANDLKERKTALNMMPGIESIEILDKSQMGLYDDENVGITAGNYASRYRAQMLGSESDQTQLDEAAKTSKTRVIGGAVAAGAGVVGGIVGDELINQSLSSSTKTAQTCTESGGTWQGGRCHCPDGYIQHTKTGPCFEEKPTDVQTTTNKQTPVNQENPTTKNNTANLSNGNNDSNSDQPGNGQSGGTSDDDNGAGGSDGKGDSSVVDIADISFKEDEFDETADAAVNENAPTVTTSAPMATTAGTAVVAATATNSGTNIDGTSSSTTTSTTGSNNPPPKSGDDNPVTVATQQSETQQSNSGNTGTTNNENSNKTTLNTDDNTTNNDDNDNDTICVEDGPDYQNNCVCTGGTVNPRDGSCTCPNNLKLNENGSCTKDNGQQRQVTTRSQPKPTAPRANTTNQKKSNTTNNLDLNKQDMSLNGTSARAYDADGGCDIKRNEDWEFLKSTLWCVDLHKGEWEVQFDYGLVRGESKCSNTEGKYATVGTPSNTNGGYCWCKVKTYKPTGGSISNIASPSWVFYYDSVSASNCASSCAFSCAYYVLSYGVFRRAVFGVAGK